MKKWKNPDEMQTLVEVLQSPDPDEPLKDRAKTISAGANAVKSIPAEDAIIIDNGRLFKAEIKLTLAPETEKYLVFITPPATAEVPMYVLWGTDLVKGDVNNVDYELWENATWTEDPGDTAQPIINQNRVLAATVLPQSQLFNLTVNPVSIAGAIEIDLDAVLGSQGGPGLGQASTGSTAAGLRFTGPLLPSKKHALRLYNNSTTETANLVVKSAFIEGLFPILYEKVNP